VPQDKFLATPMRGDHEVIDASTVTLAVDSCRLGGCIDVRSDAVRLGTIVRRRADGTVSGP